jgi:hypothetical protein
VRASPSGSSSAFSLQPVMELEALGMDLAEDDVLHNLVTRYEGRHSLEGLQGEGSYSSTNFDRVHNTRR